MNNARNIAKRVVKKIEYQVPDEPCAKLMFAVFTCAVTDLFSKKERHDAARYIRGDMPHLEIIGIDADWVRLQFRIADIDHLFARTKLTAKEIPPALAQQHIQAIPTTGEINHG